MFRQFRDFITKGNVVDLAVAVVIGAAFSVIVSSLVDDIITPLLLTPALKAAGAEDIANLSWHAVKYGKFLAAVLKFLIIAFVLFLIVKAMDKMKKKNEEVSLISGPSEVEILTEIRDLLKKDQIPS